MTRLFSRTPFILAITSLSAASSSVRTLCQSELLLHEAFADTLEFHRIGGCYEGRIPASERNAQMLDDPVNGPFVQSRHILLYIFCVVRFGGCYYTPFSFILLVLPWSYSRFEQ